MYIFDCVKMLNNDFVLNHKNCGHLIDIPLPYWITCNFYLQINLDRYLKERRNRIITMFHLVPLNLVGGIVVKRWVPNVLYT